MIAQENQVVVTEQLVPGVGDFKVGQKFNSSASYITVEKTKSYTMLKLKYIQIVKPMRKI